jgi:hypothetical protein
VQVGSGHFEIGKTASVPYLKNIYPGRERNTRFSLHPLKDQVGEVPLIIEWMWEDTEGNKYQEQSTEYIDVRAKDESQTGGTPQHIEYHFHDQAIHAAGDRVDVIKGDRIEGDQIQGDRLDAGAQKGDRVDIRRGEGVKITPDQTGGENDLALSCPTCHLPIMKTDKFCEACGTQLK